MRGTVEETEWGAKKGLIEVEEGRGYGEGDKRREGGGESEDVCGTDRKATFSMVSYRRDQAPACAYRFCPP